MIELTRQREAGGAPSARPPARRPRRRRQWRRRQPAAPSRPAVCQSGVSVAARVLGMVGGAHGTGEEVRHATRSADGGRAAIGPSGPGGLASRWGARLGEHSDSLLVRGLSVVNVGLLAGLAKTVPRPRLAPHRARRRRLQPRAVGADGGGHRHLRGRRARPAESRPPKRSCPARWQPLRPPRAWRRTTQQAACSARSWTG